MGFPWARLVLTRLQNILHLWMRLATPGPHAFKCHLNPLGQVTPSLPMDMRTTFLRDKSDIKFNTVLYELPFTQKGAPGSRKDWYSYILISKGTIFVELFQRIQRRSKYLFYIALFLFLFTFKINSGKKKHVEKVPEQVYNTHNKTPTLTHSPPFPPHMYFRQASQVSPQAQQ